MGATRKPKNQNNQRTRGPEDQVASGQRPPAKRPESFSYSLRSQDPQIPFAPLRTIPNPA